MERKSNSPVYRMKASPAKTKLGRWLMGRKKHTADDGTEVITDKRGNVVKTKSSKGVKTKYKKGSRPTFRTAESRMQRSLFTKNGI